MEPTKARTCVPVLSEQNIKTTAAIPAMLLTTVTTIRFTEPMEFGGRLTSWVLDCVKGTTGRRAAPHFLQKMSPVSAGVPHCAQSFSLTMFRVVSSIKSYAQRRSCRYQAIYAHDPSVILGADADCKAFASLESGINVVFRLFISPSVHN